MDESRRVRAAGGEEAARTAREAAEHGPPSTPHSVRRANTTATGSATDPVRGLRQLSLPTVGATQAAADAAAAVRRAEAQSASFAEGSEPADAQRVRYFRRLSKLPSQPLDATPTPTAILKFMDAVRGVLFALSQIYHALKQHISVSNDERLIAHFQRLLSLMSISMNMLITALDRLDTATQRGTPDAGVVRGVLEACSESVRTFRRTISMVHSQLAQLEESVDVRFSRTLLLMLYGSMAELRNSSAIMAPNRVEVAQYVAVSAAQDDERAVQPLRLRRTPDFSFDTVDSTSTDMLHASPQTSTPLTQRNLRTKGSFISAATRSPAVSPREARKPHASPLAGSLSPSISLPQLRVRSPSGSLREVPVIDTQLQTTLQQVTTQAAQIWTHLHTHLRSAQPQTDENAKRIRDVDDTCLSTLEQTQRLQAMLARLPEDALRARPPAPECQQLWEEANHFAIIHISTLIKAVAVHYPFPRDLMRALGELNQGCSTLAAELHASTQRM
ncbi:hypothetical protein CBS9595_001095 [Malassezia furfur]|nr:hypothetical protein CBS9595_001095 [Malassezia furfur]